MGSNKKSRFRRKLKPWAEHLFQFLMIFLAVTLGFFAENYRDNFMENVRIKQYAQSLYDDLTIDTAILQRTFDEKEWIHAKLDSAEKIIDSKQIPEYNEFLYYIERYLTLNDVFTSQNVTYQQLQSSGSFRYMKNIELYKKIADYYNLYSRYQSIDVVFGIIDKSELYAIEAKLFNIRQLTSLNNDNASNFYNLVNFPEEKLDPIKKDKEYLDQFFLQIANTDLHVVYSRGLIPILKSQATGLLIELKKEYNLQ